MNTRSELQKSYATLNNFLIHKSLYQKEYEKALSVNLYDFLIILIWKTFMLFSYEKVQQIRNIIGDEDFEKKYWKRGGLTGNKYSIHNYPISNVFCYNELKDEQIIDLLKKLYEFDNNFSKKLKVLKTDRNTAAHVVEKDLKATNTQVKNTLNFLTKAVQIIDRKHKNKFLDIIEPGQDHLKKITFSESDFEYILEAKILPGLKNAETFDVATEFMKFIKNYSEYLNSQSIKKILTASIKNNPLDNSYYYNQVIDANYGPIFFSFLLEKTYSLKSGLSKWKQFYKALGDRQKRYSKIKDLIEKFDKKNHPQSK